MCGLPPTTKKKDISLVTKIRYILLTYGTFTLNNINVDVTLLWRVELFFLALFFIDFLPNVAGGSALKPPSSFEDGEANNELSTYIAFPLKNKTS